MLESSSGIEGVDAARASIRINFAKNFSDAPLLKKLGARLRVTGVVLSLVLAGGSDPAMAHSTQVWTPTGIQLWAAAARAQALQLASTSGVASQITSGVIPAFEVDGEPSGVVGTDQPGRATMTSSRYSQGNRS